MMKMAHFNQEKAQVTNKKESCALEKLWTSFLEGHDDKPS